MKKSKLSLGLISCLLSVGTLAGCDVVRSSDNGVLLTYTVDGKKEVIKADDILADCYDDSSKYQAIFDTIYSVIVRNYFTKDRGTVTYGEGDAKVEVPLGKPQMTKINLDAAEKVSDDKDTAQTNADANNTKYKKELEAILESKGVKDVDELFDKYVEELQKETFENNFYTYQIDTIRSGDSQFKMEGESEAFWAGYLNDMLPYHVSHILVELADSSDTNYYNGTISEANARRLYNVINALSDENKSFAKVAMDYNEDPGSKEKAGDLGIMDYDTSFINEFKLGIYAYEQFYKGTNVKGSRIEVTSNTKTAYENAVKNAFDLKGTERIPTVNFSVFEELLDYADAEKDKNNKPVMEDSTLVYPRNIIYNKYLNRHAIFFIENDTATGNFVPTTFNGETTPKNILSVKVADGVYKPVIAVRAASGDKNEIHLMVVNRSPFEVTDYNGVSLEKYYTTFYPAQSMYPKDANGQLKTYVNFSSNDTSETKSRAEELASKLKSYDSDKLEKYIFLKYMEIEGIQFTDENLKLKNALMKWIKTSVEKKQDEREEAWTKTWNEYIDKLVRQNSERNKLVPQACKLVYKYGNSATEFTKAKFDADFGTGVYEAVVSALNEEGVALPDAASLVKNWFKLEGGLCNDGKTHL